MKQLKDKGIDKEKDKSSWLIALLAALTAGVAGGTIDTAKKILERDAGKDPLRMELQ